MYSSYSVRTLKFVIISYFHIFSLRDFSKSSGFHINFVTISEFFPQILQVGR